MVSVINRERYVTESQATMAAEPELPTKASPMKVNILIPMAGGESRFANQRFVQPKPLIDVGDKVRSLIIMS